MTNRIRIQPEGESLGHDFDYEYIQAITSVSYDTEVLEVRLETSELVIEVRVPSVRGHRVLLEGDMLEFWPTFSRQNGWIFEIYSGGWCELLDRRYFGAPIKEEGLKEYLINGASECINILAYEEPEIWFKSNHSNK